MGASLEAIDDRQSLLDRLHGCLVLPFLQYSGDFVAVGVSALRGTFALNCIPPRGWVASPVEEVFDADVDDVAHTFICARAGRPCQQGFPTTQAASVPKKFDEGWNTRQPVRYLQGFDYKQCPCCKKRSGRNHIRRTLGRGYCSDTASHVVFDVQQPEGLQYRVALILWKTCWIMLPLMWYSDSKCCSIGPLACDIVNEGEMTSALTPRAQTRTSPNSDGGVSKKVATSSVKFLMKGIQLLTKL